MLHAARCKCRTQKSRQKSPSGRHRTTLSGYIFATKARIDNQKNIKQQYLLHMSPQYGELRPTSGLDRFVCLGHPCKFQRVWRLGSVTARHLVMAALCNRGAIIFLPCSFFLLLLLSSSFFLSSPNLSGRRLDVYHTSTHGVALVRI